MPPEKEYVKLWVSYSAYFEPLSDTEVGRLARCSHGSPVLDGGPLAGPEAPHHCPPSRSRQTRPRLSQKLTDRPSLTVTVASSRPSKRTW